MMLIPVKVCGESWDNPDEVHYMLEKAAGQDKIVLDLQTEGPSLTAFGITNIIDAYCTKYLVDPKKIYVQNWPNRADPVKYTLVNKHHLSHFFAKSRDYWPAVVPEQQHKYTLGLFIGRKTLPRTVMMHYLYTRYKDQCLLSCMHTRVALPWDKRITGVELDKLEDWVDSAYQENFCRWWANNPVTSIDNRSVHDQYHPELNTNRDLLNFYNQFGIELVAESYSRGNTFFVTEKTVRPLSVAKPIIVYGPERYLERLRDLGYNTYSTLWDESYDRYEGPARWKMIQTVVDSIMNMSLSDRKQLISDAEKIAHQNRIHLANSIGIPL